MPIYSAVCEGTNSASITLTAPLPISRSINRPAADASRPVNHSPAVLHDPSSTAPISSSEPFDSTPSNNASIDARTAAMDTDRDCELDDLDSDTASLHRLKRFQTWSNYSKEIQMKLELLGDP